MPGRTLVPIFTSFFLCVCSTFAAANGIRPDASVEFIGPHETPLTRIRVEIADTPEARASGLMHRLLPDDESGMLFIFPKATPRAFWMRNTPGSLDMLFADAQRRIVHIARETTPRSDRLYRSEAPAMYVIETRAGFAARHSITAGVRFDYYPSPLRRNEGLGGAISARNPSPTPKEPSP